MLAGGRQDGRLSADTEIGRHLDDAAIAMVCVGTPSTHSGALDLTQIGRVSAEIGAALKGRPAGGDPLSAKSSL